MGVRDRWRLIIAFLALAFVMALMWKDAFGRNLDGRYAGSPNAEWFRSLRSVKGPCCSDSDGSTVEPEDWKTQNKATSHYSIRLGGRWFDVPDDAVLNEPNRVGRAIVWPILNWEGGTLEHVEIRCFMPGTMG